VIGIGIGLPNRNGPVNAVTMEQRPELIGRVGPNEHFVG
jgi:hypothetical protein